MNQPLIAEKSDTFEAVAKTLEDMAARIRRNKDEPFGGCFVVIPPKDGGEPFFYLGLDSQEDPVLYYQLLSARIKALLEQLDAQRRTQGGFGRG